MSETDCFTVEIEGEDVVVYKKPVDDGMLWNMSRDDYYILEQDGVYQANVPSACYEYDSLSDAWITIRRFILGDITKERLG